MPTYTLRQHDNGIFYIHWTDNRRSKRESTGATEEVAAQIYLGEWLKGEAAEKSDVTPEYRVEDLWNFYFERHIEKNSASVRTSETVWNNLAVHFGALTLPAVTRKDEDGGDKVEEYILLRQEGEIGRCEAAPATIRHELSRLKACFNWCADPKRGIIGVADVPLFDLPPDSPPRDRWLRGPEIQKLFASAAELRVGERLSRIERFLWLALETAARLVAILELTWDRVDFELGTINYNVPGRKKTKKRRAIVPISTALRPVLLRAFEERTSDYVCDTLTLSIWRGVKTVAKHAGVEGVSPHVLRHTAATHMLRRGVPIWQVAGILANTIAMVEKVYGHHVPDGLKSAVEMISGSWPEPPKLLPAPTLETRE
jgi:integrase